MTFSGIISKDHEHCRVIETSEYAGSRVGVSSRQLMDLAIASASTFYDGGGVNVGISVRHRRRHQRRQSAETRPRRVASHRGASRRRRCNRPRDRQQWWQRHRVSVRNRHIGRTPATIAPRGSRSFRSKLSTVARRPDCNNNNEGCTYKVDRERVIAQKGKGG